MTAFLIVEDEELTRESLGELLREEFPEAHIDTAANLADAIDLARKLRQEGTYYDAALLDVWLPADASGGEDGLFPARRRELLRVLTDRPLTINYSSLADDDEVRRFVTDLREANAAVPIIV